MASTLKEGPAELLSGKTLSNKWFIERRLRRDYGATGQTRSCGYKAVSLDSKTPAFVKAFDFHREELEGDTDHLERMVREYNHERNVHELSTKTKLSRITQFLESGKILIDGEAVHYIICEWADGCLREFYPPGDESITLKQNFLTLRKVASGLVQLHSVNIAHQDIKPSNAVCFNSSSCKSIKLTDLGSSSCKDMPPAPHDLDSLVGQPNYAPYELLYEQPPATWKSRRYGCDIFLLGNLCFTQITGISLTHLVMHSIPEDLRHTNFTGQYSEVIPFLIESHNDLIPEFLNGFITNEEILSDYIQLILDLCHPDPEKRGYGNDGYRLDRVVSKLDILATKAGIQQNARN